MRLKNETFYDSKANNAGVTASDYRREYTRLYTNYVKRMDALKRNGFSWTETYKDFKGIPRPSELKTERGIRRNLKGLYDFFRNPMTSTRMQKRTRKTIIENFNKNGIPLTEKEYEKYMKFLNWLADTFKNVGFSSGTIYEEYKKANNASPDGREKMIYYTFVLNNKLKLDDETKEAWAKEYEDAVKKQKDKETAREARAANRKKRKRG